MTVSGSLRSLPVVAQYFTEPDVVPAAAAEEVFAAYADAAVAVTFERAPARFVRDEHLGHELVQIELAERVTRAQPHRVGRVALPPCLLRADHDPRRPVPADPIDAMDAGRADRFAVRIDHPEDLVGRLAELLEDLFLLIERDGHPVAEVSRDLHIREPRNETRRIAVVGGPKRHAIASQNGSEHGHAQ